MGRVDEAIEWNKRAIEIEICSISKHGYNLYMIG